MPAQANLSYKPDKTTHQGKHFETDDSSDSFCCNNNPRIFLDEVI